MSQLLLPANSSLMKGLGGAVSPNKSINVGAPVTTGSYSTGIALSGPAHISPASQVAGNIIYPLKSPIPILGDYTIMLLGFGGSNATGALTTHFGVSGALTASGLSVGGNYARVSIDGNAATAITTVDTTKPHVVIGKRSANQVMQYLDGYYVNQAVTGTRNGFIISIGFGPASGNNPSTNRANSILAFWNRGLSDGEIKAISEDPWQVFAPQRRVVYFNQSTSGGAYTLTADASSYSLNGQASGLYVDRALGAQEAAFSVSGQDAGTYLGRVLTAQDSSFVSSGQDAGLLAGRTLSAQTSEFLLAGQGADLLAGRVLAGQANPFVVSGQDASLLRGYTLSAGQAAYLLSGQDADLVHTIAGAYVLTANRGDFSLQGQDAMLLLSRVLAGNAGSFSVAGVGADMLRGLSVAADAAAYIASGGNANLVYTGGYSLVCEGATFSVSPQDAQLLLDRVLQAAGQGFTFTGRDAQFTSGVAEAVMVGDIQWRVAIQRPDIRVVVGRPDNRVMIN